MANPFRLDSWRMRVEARNRLHRLWRKPVQGFPEKFFGVRVSSRRLGRLNTAWENLSKLREKVVLQSASGKRSSRALAGFLVSLSGEATRYVSSLEDALISGRHPKASSAADGRNYFLDVHNACIELVRVIDRLDSGHAPVSWANAQVTEMKGLLLRLLSEKNMAGLKPPKPKH